MTVIRLSDIQPDPAYKPMHTRPAAADTEYGAVIEWPVRITLPSGYPAFTLHIAVEVQAYRLDEWFIESIAPRTSDDFEIEPALEQAIERALHACEKFHWEVHDHLTRYEHRRAA